MQAGAARPCRRAARPLLAAPASPLRPLSHPSQMQRPRLSGLQDRGGAHRAAEEGVRRGLKRLQELPSCGDGGWAAAACLEAPRCLPHFPRPRQPLCFSSQTSLTPPRLRFLRVKQARGLHAVLATCSRCARRTAPRLCTAVAAVSFFRLPSCSCCFPTCKLAAWHAREGSAGMRRRSAAEERVRAATRGQARER
jgi:hypothetical protein